MIVVKHGDVITFRCKACGCVFKEASGKTNIANAAVCNPDPSNSNLGVYMDCPECGNSVLGYKEPEQGVKWDEAD